MSVGGWSLQILSSLLIL